MVPAAGKCPRLPLNLLGNGISVTVNSRAMAINSAEKRYWRPSVLFRGWGQFQPGAGREGQEQFRPISRWVRGGWRKRRHAKSGQQHSWPCWNPLAERVFLFRVLRLLPRSFVKDSAMQKEYCRAALNYGGMMIGQGRKIEVNKHYADAHALEDTDLAILRGVFGVAENAAVWVTEEEMIERALPFICQHLAMVIDKKDIVATMSGAYERIGGSDYGFGVFIAGSFFQNGRYRAIARPRGAWAGEHDGIHFRIRAHSMKR